MRVRFGTKKLTQEGAVHNISEGGLGLFTSVVYPPGKEFDLELEVGSVIVPVRGEVRWTRLLPADQRGGHTYEMGIRVIEPPVAYVALFRQLQKRFGPNRHSTRAKARIPLRFVQPSDVASAMTRNIAGGGAFAATDQPLKVGMLAVVELRLPGITDEVRAVARVAHVRDGSDGGEPGVGLRFLRLVAGGQDRLRRYLDGIKRQLNIDEIRVAAPPPPSEVSAP